MTAPSSSLSGQNEAFYTAMVAERRKIVLPLTILVCVFYFPLPILTNFTSALDGEVFKGVTWAYIYAFLQFFMVIIVTTYYRRRMDSVEDRLRPTGLDETAAHYDDPEAWEHHEEELEIHEHEVEKKVHDA